MQLSQVKALVTGGVSGLGLAVVRHILDQGGKAVMLDINDEAGAAAASELGTKYIRTDVTSEAGVVAYGCDVDVKTICLGDADLEGKTIRV